MTKNVREEWHEEYNLTPREAQVLSFILEGQTNKQVARVLNISPRTVEAHRAHVMLKTGARNTVDLVRLMVSPKPVEPIEPSEPDTFHLY